MTIVSCFRVALKREWFSGPVGGLGFFSSERNLAPVALSPMPYHPKGEERRTELNHDQRSTRQRTSNPIYINIFACVNLLINQCINGSRYILSSWRGGPTLAPPFLSFSLLSPFCLHGHTKADLCITQVHKENETSSL